MLTWCNPPLWCMLYGIQIGTAYRPHDENSNHPYSMRSSIIVHYYPTTSTNNHTLSPKISSQHLTVVKPNQLQFHEGQLILGQSSGIVLVIPQRLDLEIVFHVPSRWESVENHLGLIFEKNTGPMFTVSSTSWKSTMYILWRCITYIPYKVHLRTSWALSFCRSPDIHAESLTASIFVIIVNATLSNEPYWRLKVRTCTRGVPC